jgi:tetratricopeptide (TPR) repeat protein
VAHPTWTHKIPGKLSLDVLQQKFQTGLEMHRRGKLPEAAKLCEEIIFYDRKHFGAHYLLGVIYGEARKFERAVELISKAIKINSRSTEAYYNRGNALKELKRYEQALLDYDKAISLKPNFYEAYYNRGIVQLELFRFEEALVSNDKAIFLKPGFAEAYNNRGMALKELKRLADALANCEKAIELKPDYAEAYRNRGLVLTELGRLDQAFANYDKAIALKSEYSGLVWNQAIILLLQGNFDLGLPQYEHRGSREIVRKHRKYDQPQLVDAELIRGKTLFIYHELYLGDMIQFCRYAILAAQKGARVVISAQNRLHDLLSTLGPGIEIIPEGTEPDVFDYHVPLMSLPLAFHTELENIPGKVPYLRPDAARVLKWKTAIGEHGFKIGICWQGSRLSEESGRSLPLTEFFRLSKMPDVRLISLQKFDGLEQLETLSEDMKVETLGDEFDAGSQAFLDTAAVIANLDLVITCDTALAHLAGALARPAWVALKFVPDWRWLLNRSDSPWYPTLRLFRQDEPFHWRSAFEKMEMAARDLMQSRQPGEMI